VEYKILAVDDDSLFLTTLTERLKPHARFELETVTNGLDAIERIKQSPFKYAVVLLDYEMPNLSGAQAIMEMLKINSQLIIAMNSGHSAKDIVVECVRAGAIDFFVKGEPSDVFLKKLDSYCAKYEATGRILESSKDRSQHEELINSIGKIGKSEALAKVAQIVTRAARESCGVLIQGETGTVKELVAKAIHNLSPRKSRTFVALNVNSITESLLESELFGHVKGAFTGAIESKIGKFKLADGGTLFLDEIGDLKMDLQVKLLRVLQDGEFYPVGSNKSEKVNVRIVAATHVDLQEAIKNGKFRQDLYYRVNVLNIQVPALRERPEDIRPLILHFQKKHRLQGKVFLMRAIKRMEVYSWPGNIRELENDVQRLGLNSENAISDVHLHSKFFELDKLSASENDIRDFEQVEIIKDRLEIDLISKSLKRFRNLTRAAEFLNVGASTLHKKMKRLNLLLEDFT
jgi:DNA-binding NtrC family response regulator